MMRLPRGILLTGSTGMLGRYLLKDLLEAGCRLTVLVRDNQSKSATDRVGEIVEHWREQLGRHLPIPAVVRGDLREDGLGLSAADRRWISVSCDSVVHAAADLSFRPTVDSEPCASNIEGTQRLVNLCQRLHLSELHHISTAFVCGKTEQVVLEDEPKARPSFHNVYEQSKFESERIVRTASGLRSTIYRPSVIVGDSRSGYTSSYTGIYRFLQFAAKLSEPIGKSSNERRRLPLRLPITGDEPRNLVTVDWVSEAITRIVSQPRLHGRTYHLASTRPIPTRMIEDAARIALNLDGISFAGPDAWNDRSAVECLFLDHLEEYWPYLHGDPAFDCSNLMSALPKLPPTEIDVDLLVRLIEFAVKDRWGKGQEPRPAPLVANRVDCREYMEQIFPEQSRRSPLARAAKLNVAVGIDVRGVGGGQWTCRWVNGELTHVQRGLTQPMEVVYHLDENTFGDLISGRQTPPDAFFAKRIEVDGDVEKALKLAVLFGHFLVEVPASPITEAAHGVLGSV